MFGYWEKKEEQEKEVTHMETIDRKYTKNVVSGRFYCYVKRPTRTDAEIIRGADKCQGEEKLQGRT